MQKNGIKFEFQAKVYQYPSSVEAGNWTIVSLPKELSAEIRDNFKWLEQGWGRMKVTARIGRTQWQTAIWFDTKLDTHLLPLKAQIREKENIVLDQNVKIEIWV